MKAEPSRLISRKLTENLELSVVGERLPCFHSFRCPWAAFYLKLCQVK